MKNYRILILIPFLFTGLWNQVLAQAVSPEDGDEKGGRVQAAKVAYISSKLNLTTAQAQQFWPLFNEFEKARKKIRKQIRNLRVDNMLADGTEDELKGDIRRFFALRQEELDMEKSYAEKFLKVISARQLAEFYRSEKEFTRLLLRRLKNRGLAGGPGKQDADE